MTRRAGDSLNPDAVDVQAAIERGRQQQADAQRLAERMTEAARDEHQQRRDETRDLRGGRD